MYQCLMAPQGEARDRSVTQMETVAVLNQTPALQTLWHCIKTLCLNLSVYVGPLK